MKAAILVFPGTNRERDMALALEAATGAAPVMVWHGDAEIPSVDLIVVPGGFSHGDYLRCGAMAAHSPVIGAVKARAEAGVPILGVCNGFQILTECGLLPGALLRNLGLEFVCRDVWLRVDTTDSLFTRGYAPGDVIRIPVAHHDGNYRADGDTLKELEVEDRIAFRYSGAGGETGGPHNPNGSTHHIAGILNAARNVLGMMPHPERLADARLGGTDGKPMFAGLVEALV